MSDGITKKRTQELVRALTSISRCLRRGELEPGDAAYELDDVIEELTIDAGLADESGDDEEDEEEEDDPDEDDED